MIVPFTITPLVTDFLSAIDTLRTSILTTPMTPAKEQELQWRATVSYISGTLKLEGTALSERKIHETIRTLSESKTVTTIRETLFFIRKTWTGNTRPLSAQSIEEVACMLYPTKKETVRKHIRNWEVEGTHMLRYVTISKQHPVITSSLVHFALFTNPPLAFDHGILARMIEAGILASYGYDVRGMVTPLTIYAEDPTLYIKSIDVCVRQQSATSWIEYNAKAIKQSMKLLERTLSFPEQHSSHPILNDRQERILMLLEHPSASVTNRMLQKRFRISQITASRDLARLTALGILSAHGKGRSVRYTRG